MVDTYTTPGGARQIEQYTLENAWGPELNEALQRLADLVKVRFVTVNGNVSLAYNDGIDHVSSGLLLVLTGAGGFLVTEPGKGKPFLIYNGCVADVTMKPLGAATAATIRAGTLTVYWPSVDNSAGNVADVTLDRIKAPAATVNLGAQKIQSSVVPTVGNDLANKTYVDTFIADRSAGGFKLTNLADAVSAQDATALAQVIALIASATVNMPAQTANGGKFLQTDGTNPSWQKVDVSSASQVTGALAIPNGGTGQVTAAAARIALLPVLTAHGSHVLCANAGATDFELVASDVAFSAVYVSRSRTTLANDAAASFTLQSSKREHIFEMQDVVPATDAVNFLLLASIDAGANYNVSISGRRLLEGVAAAISAATTGAAFFLNVGSDPSEYGVTGRMTFSQKSGEYGRILFHGMFVNASGTQQMVDVLFEIATTSAITNLQLKYSSGNLESGFVDYITRDN